MNLLARKMSSDNLYDIFNKESEPPFIVKDSEHDRYDKSAKDSLKDIYKELREAQSQHLSELVDLWTLTESSLQKSESIVKIEFLKYLRLRLITLFAIGAMSFGVSIFMSYDLYLYMNKVQSIFDPLIDLILFLMSLSIVIISLLGINRLIEYRVKAEIYFN